jgi:hypothetical protein
VADPVKGSGTQACTDWLKQAQKVVVAAYPAIFFGKDDPDANANERALEYCLDEYFCVPDSYMDWEGVMEAWRRFYRSCIPF